MHDPLRDVRVRIKSIFILITIVSGLLLSACTTAEYRRAKNDCSPEAYRQYPVNSVTKIITLYRTVEVPTGREFCNCRQVGYQQRCTCRQETILESRPYQQTMAVDTNSKNRNSAMNSCAQRACYERYGNAGCKTKEVPSGNHPIERSQINRTNNQTKGQHHELPTTHHDGCAARYNPSDCSDATDQQILDRGYR
jgi:hypothetical protein